MNLSSASVCVYGGGWVLWGVALQVATRLNERDGCCEWMILQRPDGSVSRSLRFQSCSTLLPSPHLTANFQPARHKHTHTHVHTNTHKRLKQQKAVRMWTIKTHIKLEKVVKERGILSNTCSQAHTMTETWTSFVYKQAFRYLST